MRHHGRTAAIALALAACGGTAGGPSIPTPVNGFRADDRVVIGDFSRVNAIASTTDRVYVAYPTAVAVWLPLERRWDVPRSPRDPSRLRSVQSAVVDPIDRTLWLAVPGGWLHYDPFANQWIDIAQPTHPLPQASSVADAFRDIPQLRSLAPHIATGPLMVPGVLTAAAPDPQHGGWFIGTSNRGLVFFDRLGTDATAMPLGLFGDVVGAILPTSDGIWVATDADLRRPASVSRLSADLTQSRSIPGSASQGLPFTGVRRFLLSGGMFWMATDKGAVRLRMSDGRLDRFDAGTGLPEDRVVGLAEYRGDVVAGTLRGLARSRGDSGFVRLAAGFTDPVYSLLARGDTLWAGTVRGLFALIPGNDDLLMPDGFRAIGGSGLPILGTGYIADTLVALTSDRVVWRDPRSGAWSQGPSLSTQLGPLVAFDVGPEGAWIAGARGVAFVRPGTAPLRLLLVGEQLPDEVTAVASSGRFLWIGTRGGLVRYLLEGQ